MLYRTSLFRAGAVLLLLFAVAAPADEYAQLRQRLVEEIEQDVRATSMYLDKEELDARVMEAIGKVPR